MQLTEHRDTASVRRFFVRALRHGTVPVEVTTERQRRTCRGDHRRHAFVQILRRGHYELATDVPPQHQLTATFAELALAI